MESTITYDTTVYDVLTGDKMSEDAQSDGAAGEINVNSDDPNAANLLGAIIAGTYNDQLGINGTGWCVKQTSHDGLDALKWKYFSGGHATSDWFPITYIPPVDPGQ